MPLVVVFVGWLEHFPPPRVRHHSAEQRRHGPLDHLRIGSPQCLQTTVVSATCLPEALLAVHEALVMDVATPVAIATAMSALEASTSIDAMARVVSKESLQLVTCRFYVGVRVKAAGLTETRDREDREPQMLSTMFYLLAQLTLLPVCTFTFQERAGQVIFHLEVAHSCGPTLSKSSVASYLEQDYKICIPLRGK